MSKVTITIDGTQVPAMFRCLADAAGDPESALRDIGEHELRATRERAGREQGPDGVPWVALPPRYAARKAKTRGGLPMLKFENRMLGDQLNYQVVPPHTLGGSLSGHAGAQTDAFAVLFGEADAESGQHFAGDPLLEALGPVVVEDQPVHAVGHGATQQNCSHGATELLYLQR